MSSFDISKYKLIFEKPDIYFEGHGWLQHIPFAYFLIELLKPETIVELGVHGGNSFCAFCKAVNILNINTKCFGIDTWKGDYQSGFYGEEVYAKLLDYTNKEFSGNAVLLRSTFDNGLKNFKDNSIDILHIDGLHSYEDVKHDFYAWLPKVSSSGVVIMHDTLVKKNDFGVWKLWNELSVSYLTLNFFHGFGLGVLCKSESTPKNIKDFVKYANKEQVIKSFFAILGERIELKFRKQQFEEKINKFYSENQKNEPKFESQIWLVNREDATIRSMLKQKIYGTEKQLSFKIEEFDSQVALQVSPINDYCHLRINNVLAQDKKSQQYKLSFFTNAIRWNLNEYEFVSNMPQIFINTQELDDIVMLILDIEFIWLGKESLSKSVQRLERSEKSLISLQSSINRTSLTNFNKKGQLRRVKQISLDNDQYESIEKDSIINEQVKKIRSLQQIIENVQNDFSKIKNSISWKIGSLIVFPFRIFRNKFIESKAYLFLQLIKISLLFPFKIVASINRKNINKLYNALRNEPPVQIIKNIRLYLINKQTLENDKFEHDTYRKEHESKDIIIHCDHALIFDKRISVTGWAIAKLGIDKIEVLIENSSLTKMITGKLRNDVAQEYSTYVGSSRSGFSYQFKIIKEHLNPNFAIIKACDKNGEVAELKVKLQFSYQYLDLNQQYKIFQTKNKLSSGFVKSIKEDCRNFEYKPKISVIVPVYNTEQIHLERCIQSVLKQYYNNWELCLFDDGSTNIETKTCLQKYSEFDKRISVAFGNQNQNISKALNSAIGLSYGEFLGFLDHDDELTADALYEVVKVLNNDRFLDLIYSDEDKIDEDNNLVDPYFKSDFNLEMLLSNNYICHFTVVRKTLGDHIGWFRVGYEGSQDYDFYLRVVDITRKIFHIPKVLYHWRKIPGSTSYLYSEKNYAHLASKKALEDYLKRNRIFGQVLDGDFKSIYRIRKEIIDQKLISIIIPFVDKVELLKRCLQSIFKNTEYPSYEIILISNNSKEDTTYEYLQAIQQRYDNIRYYIFNMPFNYSKINNWAVKKCKGEYLLFLNNDVEVLTNGWLKALAEHINRKEVGVVGAKLLYPDDTIQHAGIILKIGGIAGHSHKYISNSNPGYFSRPHMIQRISAVTAACMLVKRGLFNRVGGFDEKSFPVAFNDVDFCLKIQQFGYHVIYTPYSVLYHYESKSRGKDNTKDKQKRFKQEIKEFEDRWSLILLKGDPYYNPNLTLKYENFGLNV